MNLCEIAEDLMRWSATGELIFAGIADARRQTAFFAQLPEYLPLTTLRRCVALSAGEHRIKNFTCLEQFLCLAFAQLTYQESLRDIEACLRAQREKLYPMGIRSRISRSTLADANKVRDWRIYADYGQRLIARARNLYVNGSFGVDLNETVYALNTTTIDCARRSFRGRLFDAPRPQ